MLILEDKEEKRALFIYSTIAYIFVSSISFLTFNDYVGLKLSFLKLFLISFSLLSFGGIFYSKWENRMYKLFGKKFNQLVVAGIFSFIILPLALASSMITFLYFDNLGLAVLNGTCIFFGALINQAAIDTIVKVYRKEKENALKERLTFKKIISKK